MMLGGENPVRIQSMTNTDSNDIDSTVSQCIQLTDAGCELIRITAQGEREARNLALIKEQLRKKGYQVPLAADIHFNPKAAEIAATIVDKVRINPGNYTDRIAPGKFEFSDKEYELELEHIAERISPLLQICKHHGTAIRIGTNHGSLSKRIMNRYGDTPLGMVESALEFARICESFGFRNLVLSMKSSNVRVMVQATRLLVHRMIQENLDFPLHLGVTEAGDGEDGIIKSAAGIGALLEDGIGDTIRVSLTGDPVKEIPVAKEIAGRYNCGLRIADCGMGETEDGAKGVPSGETEDGRMSAVGSKQEAVGTSAPLSARDMAAEHSALSTSTPLSARDMAAEHPAPLSARDMAAEHSALITSTPLSARDMTTERAARSTQHDNELDPFSYRKRKSIVAGSIGGDEPVQVIAGSLNSACLIDEAGQQCGILLLEYFDKIIIASGTARETRLLLLSPPFDNDNQPLLITNNYSTNNLLPFQVNAAIDFGALLIDGLGDAILLQAPMLDSDVVNRTAFGILQATRSRITRTEFISCPSCGRTLFDIEETLKQVKAATGHLKGLKIAVMGCIVNGPGEMADADYGYVGAGKGRITLYKGVNMIRKNIPEVEAIHALVELIKQSGHWKEAAS